MTKEDIAKEAEEYADWFWGASPSMMKALANAYIKGAEPREKRIAELENYNKKLLEGDIDKQNKNTLLSKKVNDLQKENNDLKTLVAEGDCLMDNCREMADKVAELEKENEIFKKANEIIAQQRDGRDADISILENRIEELEKENAELKRFIKDLIYENHNRCFQFSNTTCLFNSDYRNRAEELIGEKL